MKKTMIKKIFPAFLLALGMASEVSAGVFVDTLDALREAIFNVGSGDIITLTDTITLTAESSDISIGRSVIIKGNGHALSGGGFSIFSIAGPHAVSFDLVTFADARNALRISGGEVSFSNCKFEDNDGDSGAAVGVSGGTVAFTGGSFTGNGATGSGGAVSITAGEVSFSGGTAFSGNKTTGSVANGGAVNVAGGIVSFSGGSFSDNSATGNGGAVSAAGGTVSFSNGVLFSGNRTTGSAASGGAVNVAGGTVTFTGGNFSDNSATGSGGAVNVATGTVSFGSGTSFSGNKTTGSAANGGAVNVAGGTATFGDSSFTGNSATGNGGAINTTGAVTLSGGSFKENKANTVGGAISAGSVTATVEVDFTQNTAGSGGAISTTGTVSLAGGTLEANTATTGGGGAISTAGTVALSGGFFKENKANTVGGAISAGSVTATAPVKFDGNEAKTSGGAVDSGGVVTFDRGGSFMNNKAGTGDGGAVRSGGNATFDDCLFEGNSSGLAVTGAGTTGSGGAVSSGGAFAGTNCTFSDNEAKISGGAVHLLFAGTGNRVEKSVFTGNSAAKEGGAVHAAVTTSAISFLRSLFSGNQITDTGTGGGAIFLTGTGIFEDCTLTGNTAGAMFNSTAPIRGGAVYAAPPVNGSVTFTNCTFTRNRISSLQSDAMGGALWVSGKSDMRYCTLTDKNEAFASATYGKGFGGGVYVESGPFSITACAISGNTANYGDDIFRRENVIINTGGYNRLRYYGIVSTALGSPYPTEFSWRSDGNVRGAPEYDKEGITQASMFGSYSLATNSISGVVLEIGGGGKADVLSTVRLLSDDVNPARNQIPNREGTLFAVKTDQRGVARPQPDNGFFDVGAFEAHKDEGAGVSPGPDQEYVDSVKMGGIPNKMTKVGEQSTLVATVFPTRASQKVVWDSSVPGVASIDAFGNLTSLSLGTTRIIVRTEGTKPDGYPAVDSADLTVRDEMSYIDVGSGVLGKLMEFNADLQRYAERVSLVDADPAEVDAASFQSAFKNVWGIAPMQVTVLQNVNEIAFSSRAGYAGNNWVSVKPSIGVSLASLPVAGGSLLVLEYTWSLTWSEVSAIMESTVTKTDSVTALFQKLKLVFEGVDGVAMPVADADGEFGVAASKAGSSGVLTVVDGNNGLTLRLRIMAGDLTGTRREMIGSELVVADGVADGTIGGTMWLLKRTGGGESGGNSGGGCNSGIVFAALLGVFLPALWIKRDS